MPWLSIQSQWPPCSLHTVHLKIVELIAVLWIQRAFSQLCAFLKLFAPTETAFMPSFAYLAPLFPPSLRTAIMWSLPWPLLSGLNFSSLFSHHMLCILLLQHFSTISCISCLSANSSASSSNLWTPQWQKLSLISGSSAPHTMSFTFIINASMGTWIINQYPFISFVLLLWFFFLHKKNWISENVDFLYIFYLKSKN